MVEDFEDARFQRDAGGLFLAEMLADLSRPGREVEALAEMVEQDLVAGGMLQPDHTVKDRERNLGPDAGRRPLHGAQDHRLGVDQEAVHVEHDGLDDSGEAHGAG